MFCAIARRVLGAIILFLISLNLIFTGIFILLAYGLSVLVLVKKWRYAIRRYAVQTHLPGLFAFLNRCFLKLPTRGLWDVKNSSGLKADGSYLMIANHQSWIDILVLHSVFNYKIPPLKFFIKKQLLWQLPFAGLAMYVMGYPIVSRHTHAQVRKNPNLKGKDIQTTRRSCRQLKEYPATLINFVEGTRFTEKKYEKQNSPFRYLLKPKAGGVSIALQELHDTLDGIINVTILYPGKKPSMWDFVCGNFNKVFVRYELLPITSEMLGDYENDRIYRVLFQQWLNNIWQKNDELLADLVKNYEQK